MSKKSENVKYLEKALEEFGPVTLDYAKDKVVGFANENGGSDLIIYVKEDEMVMSFGFQNAHFAAEDAFSCAEHTKKYLLSEYASVEFFKGENDLFGGSRPSSTVNFSTVEGIVNCYSCGNEVAAEGLYKFFKENGEITVRAVNFSNEINKVSKIISDGENLTVKVVRE